MKKAKMHIRLTSEETISLSIVINSSNDEITDLEAENRRIEGMLENMFRPENPTIVLQDCELGWWHIIPVGNIMNVRVVEQKESQAVSSSSTEE